MTDQNAIPTPPSLDELRAAAKRIAEQPPSPEALMHLALPATVAVGVDASFQQGRWAFRGVSHAPGGDPYIDAVTLATVTHRDGDTYLDLSGSPAAWVKPLRSGSRLVCYGAEAMLGLPRLAADPWLRTEQVFDFLADVTAGSGRRPCPPVVLDTASGPVLLDGTDDAWALRSPDGVTAAAPLDLSPLSVPDMAEGMAAALGGERFEVVELPSRFPGSLEVEVLIDLRDGWQVIVPVTVANGSEVLGVAPSDVIADNSVPVPSGFTAIGRSRWEDASVARHATGLTVLTRTHSQ